MATTYTKMGRRKCLKSRKSGRHSPINRIIKPGRGHVDSLAKIENILTSMAYT